MLWNTAKIAIAALVTYLFVNMFSWTLTPFFELFESAHPLIYFMAVGFWVGAATWPAGWPDRAGTAWATSVTTAPTIRTRTSRTWTPTASGTSRSGGGR